MKPYAAIHPTRLTMTLLATVLVLFLSFFQVCAQRNRYEPVEKAFFLGATAGAGARTFSIRSNIDALKNLKVSEEGIQFGVEGGSRRYQLTARYGSFKSSDVVREQVKLSEVNIGVRTFPLQLLNKRTKYFKPYGFVDINRQRLRFYGDFDLPVPPPSAPSGMSACPDAPPAPGMGGPADPPSLPEGESSKRVLGSLIVMRADLGIGMQIHLPSGRRFVNLYSEVAYGANLGTKAETLEFQRTHVSNQFTVQLGVAFGLKTLYH